MGKDGELWDDSALIKAFDRSISKYQMMHGTSVEKGIKEKLPAAEHVQNKDNHNTARETNTKVGETTLQSNEELGSSSNCAGSFNVQDNNVLLTSGIPAAKSGYQGTDVISSDVKSQNETISCSSGPEEYNKLLNKYYEIEDQRQQILQQLNQYSNWNYQYPVSSTSTAEEHQSSLAQSYDTVTCHCPYGCQNWAVPCNSLPTSYSGSTCVDKCCQAIPKDSKNGNSVSPEDPDHVKTAMLAAERALSLTKEANGGPRQLGMELGQFPESNSGTELHVVLNAWYSAGFYTGRYLSEQSLEKGKHGQGV